MKDSWWVVGAILLGGAWSLFWIWRVRQWPKWNEPPNKASPHLNGPPDLAMAHLMDALKLMTPVIVGFIGLIGPMVSWMSGHEAIRLGPVKAAVVLAVLLDSLDAAALHVPVSPK